MKSSSETNEDKIDRYFNLTELSEITGIDRSVVAKRIRGLRTRLGVKNSVTCCSIKAIPAIVAGTDKRTGRQNIDSYALLQMELGLKSSHYAEFRDLVLNSNERVSKEAMDALATAQDDEMYAFLKSRE